MKEKRTGTEILRLIGEYKRLDKKRDQGLNASEQKRFEELAALLESYLDKNSKDKEPKRKDLRVRCTKQVQVKTDYELKQLLLHNISGGGLYLATQDFRPIGSPIEIEIQIEERKNPVHLTGVVAWINTKDLQGLPSGIGIKFTNLTQDQQTFLREIIHAALDRQSKEESE